MFSRASKPVLLDFLLAELAKGLSPNASVEDVDPIAFEFREEMERLERPKAKARLKAQSYLTAAKEPYIPYGSNEEAIDSTDEEVLLSGAAGTGKTRAWLEKMHTLAQTYPGFRGLIVRKTRESLSETGLFTFEEYVLGKNHPLLNRGGERRTRKKYVYPNGSEIVVGGLDKPIKIMSSEYDMIYVQEAIEIRESEWEDLSTRLRNFKMPYQQIAGDTNPSHPQHWLKLRCDSGLTRLIFCRHEDNPSLFDRVLGEWTLKGKDYIKRLDRLTGVRYLRLRLGKWVQAEGAVYQDYDESIHLINRFAIPHSWKRYRVIDFGYTNPFVCQWWAMDDDGRLYLYREIYHTRRIVEDHAKRINELSANENIEYTIADHDAEDRATLDRFGISTIAATKDVTTGIQAVQSRLRDAGDGKPRIFILRDSLVEQDAALVEDHKPTSTQAEISGYMWAKSADGKPNNEQPVKVDDHGVDSMRYMVAAFDLGSTSLEHGEMPNAISDYFGT